MLRAVLFALRRNLLSATYMTSWLDRVTHYNGHTIGLELLFGGASIVLTSELTPISFTIRSSSWTGCTSTWRTMNLNSPWRLICFLKSQRR